ncbi:hypothetical protein D3C87_2164330 [compost metagenome]
MPASEATKPPPIWKKPVRAPAEPAISPKPDMAAAVALGLMQARASIQKLTGIITARTWSGQSVGPRA